MASLDRLVREPRPWRGFRFYIGILHVLSWREQSKALPGRLRVSEQTEGLLCERR